MSDSVVAVFVAFVLAVAGFSGFCLSSPSVYTLDPAGEEGLIRDIVFDKPYYNFLEGVHARLVYRNPSNRAISINVTYPIMYNRYFDGKQYGGGGEGGDWRVVTIPAGGEYTVCEAGFLVDDAVGWCELDWDGVRRGVEVGVGEVVPRVVTDKQRYIAGEGGTAIYELYNPTGHNVTSNLPGCFFFDRYYTDGSFGGGLSGICIDWAWANVTIPPKGSFRVFTFYFTTSDHGSFDIVGGGTRTRVCVLPR